MIKNKKNTYKKYNINVIRFYYNLKIIYKFLKKHFKKNHYVKGMEVNYKNRFFRCKKFLKKYQNLDQIIKYNIDT